MEKAKYGDVIYTKHKIYKHYGIYINDDCVIHYDGKIDDMWLRNMFIRQTNMKRFLAGADRYYIYKGKSYYSPEETVHRAKSRLGEGSFNLLTNNCEHVSMWCKTGQSKSMQVNLVELGIALFCLYKVNIKN